MLVFITCIVVLLLFIPTFSLSARNVLGVEVITEYLKIQRLSGLSLNLSLWTKRKWMVPGSARRWKKEAEQTLSGCEIGFNCFIEQQAPPHWSTGSFYKKTLNSLTKGSPPVSCTSNITEQATVLGFERALIRREENRDTEKWPLGHRTNILYAYTYICSYRNKTNQKLK